MSKQIKAAAASAVLGQHARSQVSVMPRLARCARRVPQLPSSDACGQKLGR